MEFLNENLYQSIIDRYDIPKAFSHFSVNDAQVHNVYILTLRCDVRLLSNYTKSVVTIETKNIFQKCAQLEGFVRP